MVTNNHYRWDFIGLSTDVKPTPATSEKVVDGSTFYCSDTSKLYVYCKDNWYERKPLGGGGSSYTAGNGIDITDSTISVDTTVVQEKLTAGEGITISDNTISASGGGGVKTLTTADYNYPENNPDGIALWLLDNGDYLFSTNLKVYRQQGVSETWGNRDYLKVTSKGTDAVEFSSDTGRWSNIELSTSGSYSNVSSFMYGGYIVQTTGQNDINVMSQKAVTDAINALATRVSALEGN